MMLTFSVLAVFVLRAWLRRESRTEAREHASFYLRGREPSTIAAYDTEYKRLVEYCVKFGKAVCGFGEKELVSYIIYRSK